MLTIGFSIYNTPFSEWFFNFPTHWPSLSSTTSLSDIKTLLSSGWLLHPEIRRFWQWQTAAPLAHLKKSPFPKLSCRWELRWRSHPVTSPSPSPHMAGGFHRYQIRRSQVLQANPLFKTIASEFIQAWYAAFDSNRQLLAPFYASDKCMATINGRECLEWGPPPWSYHRKKKNKLRSKIKKSTGGQKKIN